MTHQELRNRTKHFAIRVVRLVNTLSKSYDGRIIGAQILRSGTSVAANYRAVCRARTKKEFISKVRIVLEEVDETQFWLEILHECGYVRTEKIIDLLKESSELVAIFTKTLATARQNSEK